MKSLSRLLALFVVSPAAFAASPFLPISATNTFRSGERAIVEAAEQQAESEGKLLYIDMAAAWCGPCYALEKSEEDNKDDLAPTLAHFVPVKLEEMFIETTLGADFIPSEIPWFPSLFIYNPGKQKWTMIYASDEPSLKATMNDYLAHDNLSAYYLQQLMAKIARGDKIADDDVMTAMVPLSFEASGKDFLAATSGVIKAMKAKPDQFGSSVTDMETNFNDVYLRALEMNKVTYDQIKAADADALGDMKTSATLTTRIYFHAQLGNLIRTAGNKAASDKCDALSAAAAKAIADQKDDVKRKMQIARDIACLVLKVELKEKAGTDVLAYEASMSDAERTSAAYSLAKVFALTGTNFDKAISYAKIWQDTYYKALAKRPELLARVKIATEARLAAYAAGKTHP